MELIKLLSLASSLIHMFVGVYKFFRGETDKANYYLLWAIILFLTSREWD